MIQNYFKIAFCHFLHQKLYSVINMIGLALGLTVACIVFLFIRHERSFDRFHNDHQNIYWLWTHINQSINISGTPGPLAPDLESNFAEVTEHLRLEQREIVVESGKEVIKEKAVFVDSNFFQFFDFPLTHGYKDQVLAQLNSIVLTEELAIKYFGRENPVDKILPVYINGSKELLTVSGIAQNAPSNSSLQFTCLIPIQQAYKSDINALQGKWNSFPITSFIRLRQDEDIMTLQEKLPDYTVSKYSAGESDAKFDFVLNAFDDYHLDNTITAAGLVPPSDKSYVKILSLIALIILIVACLNFMNLSNARSSQRLKEVGVRRVLGAGRQQLMKQFLTESILTSLLSLGAAILLMEAFLPVINRVFGYSIYLDWQNTSIVFSLVGIAVISGLFAGLYPSILISKLKPVNAFKSDIRIGGNNLVTKGSLVFQFIVSIGLLACTFIMYQQQEYIENRNLVL